MSKGDECLDSRSGAVSGRMEGGDVFIVEPEFEMEAMWRMVDAASCDAEGRAGKGESSSLYLTLIGSG